jgi:hypothetical protein
MFEGAAVSVSNDVLGSGCRPSQSYLGHLCSRGDMAAGIRCLVQPGAPSGF